MRKNDEDQNCMAASSERTVIEEIHIAGLAGSDTTDTVSEINRDPLVDVVCFSILGILGAIVGMAFIGFLSPPVSLWWGASLGIVTAMRSSYDEIRIK